MEKFFGGNPLAVILRLVLISIVVGIVLRALGILPHELFRVIPNLIETIYEFSRGWVESLFNYFLLGAVIVVPIWLVVRLVRSVGSGGEPKGGSKPR
jgi:ABC-type enterochelin transport system permease subunit